MNKNVLVLVIEYMPESDEWWLIEREGGYEKKIKMFDDKKSAINEANKIINYFEEQI